MAEVARAAKVCRATVSLALRNQPQIPEVTRQRIREIALKLGYAPHPLVSALMATRRRPSRFKATIAFVTNHLTRDGWRKSSKAYASFFEGAQARAKSLGYALQVFWMRDPSMPAERLKKILQARGIHGLILSPLPAESATLPAFDWQPFSVLALGYSTREPEFHRISHDYFHGMNLALRHCRAHGYRRIGFFIDHRVNRVVFNLWLAAFLAEQKTATNAVSIDPLLVEGVEDPKILPWVRRNRLDALIGLDPWRMRELGLTLPAGLALVGLNADEGPTAVPGISRDFDLIGAAAVDRMISLLHVNDKGAPERPQTVLIEGMWLNDDKLPVLARPRPRG